MTRAAGTGADYVEPMRDSELHLRMALESSYVIAFEWDIERDEVRRIFSTDATLAPTPDGMPTTFAAVRDVVHPDDRAVFEHKVREAFAHPEGRYFSEYRIVRADGEVAWLGESGRVQFDRQGRPQRLIGLSQDITSRKETEMRLAASESALRSIFDTSPMMLGLVELSDDDAEILHIFDSPSTARFFASPGRSTAGQPASVLGAPVDVERLWIARYRESERQGRAVHFEYEHARGDEFVWLSCIVVPVHRGPSGRMRFSYTATDVTERKLAEQRIEGQARLLDLSRDAILTRDGADRITFWNRGAEELYGYSRDEALGQVSHDLLKTRWPGRLADIREHLHSEGQWQGELVHSRKDGRPVVTYSRWVLRSSDASGNAFVLESNTDISERKEWEQQLVDSAQRKDQHLAMLAHELRNPLAPLRTSSDIIRAHARDDPLLQRCGAIMERQIAQMGRLLDDLLDISRFSRGITSLKCTPVRLRDVLDIAVETAGPSIAERDHQLVMEDVDARLVLNADAARLAQAFGNLLNNAAKYSDRGGQIRISVTVEGSRCSVAVSDTGFGIPPEWQARAFELFEQVKGAGLQGTGGLGIGLPLAREIVERHGGLLELTSSAVGRGSVFTVTLPVTVAPDADVSPAARAQSTPGFDGRRVLVVDDNQDAADMLAVLIEQLGGVTRKAYDGEAAVLAVTEWTPSLILLDLGMPGMSGHEVCRRIRQMPGGQAIGIVAMTGWGMDADRRKTREAGFDDHLVKPVATEVLLRVISRY